MFISHQPIDWNILNDDDEEIPHWLTPLGDDSQQDVDESPHQYPNPSRLYELILGIAVFYGVAVFFVWQRAEHQIAVLEDEMVLLREEVERKPEMLLEDSDSLWLDATPDERDNRIIHYFETQYLRFESSDRTADLVEDVAPQVDAKYQKLHRDFRMALDSSGDKLTILVDSAEDSSYNDEHILAVSSPDVAANRYNISKKEALVNEVSMKLIGSVLDNVLKNRNIKPQWRTMVLELSFYLQRETGHNRNWRQDDFYRQRRRLAVAHPLEIVYPTNAPTLTAEGEGITGTVSAEEIADPLVEYIFETYEYSIGPSLLDAFEQHSNWDTLVPDLFGLSASEFEREWHTYLRRNYPPMSFE